MAQFCLYEQFGALVEVSVKDFRKNLCRNGVEIMEGTNFYNNPMILSHILDYSRDMI